MTSSERLAIAAHLHVLLRRKTGRVTDTEWMARNAEYAAEIVRFSLAKAAEDNHPELAEWAGRLERAMSAPAQPAARTLVQLATQALRPDRPPVGASPPPPAAREAASQPAADSLFPDSRLDTGPEPEPRGPSAPRYVGGIR